MDTFKTLCNDHLYSEQSSSLGRPIPARSGTLLGPGDHNQRNSLLLVAYRCFVDGKLVTTWIVFCHSSFDAGYHQILDPDIGKRPAGHDQIIATPATIAIEVNRLHTTADQILTSGRALLNRPSRGDMIGSHRIAKDSQ